MGEYRWFIVELAIVNDEGDIVKDISGEKVSGSVSIKANTRKEAKRKASQKYGVVATRVEEEK